MYIELLNPHRNSRFAQVVDPKGSKNNFEGDRYIGWTFEGKPLFYGNHIDGSLLKKWVYILDRAPERDKFQRKIVGGLFDRIEEAGWEYMKTKRELIATGIETPYRFDTSKARPLPTDLRTRTSFRHPFDYKDPDLHIMYIRQWLQVADFLKTYCGWETYISEDGMPYINSSNHSHLEKLCEKLQDYQKETTHVVVGIRTNIHITVAIISFKDKTIEWFDSSGNTFPIQILKTLESCGSEPGGRTSRKQWNVEIVNRKSKDAKKGYLLQFSFDSPFSIGKPDDGIDSTRCTIFAIAYAILRCRGKTSSETMDLFIRNMVRNRNVRTFPELVVNEALTLYDSLEKESHPPRFLNLEKLAGLPVDKRELNRMDRSYDRDRDRGSSSGSGSGRERDSRI